MNKKRLFYMRFLAIAIFSLDTQLALAQWHCTAEDRENRSWLAISNYEKSAINKAMAVCKKESQYPKTCKTSRKNCDLFVHGISTKPTWRCTAFDRMANVWYSNPYPHPDDAALGAKAYCQQRSAFPETCYVYLLTCKNTNPLRQE